MSYLGPLFPPTLAIAMLLALPGFTFMLMRRAGIRGWKLLLALLPVVCMFLGGYVFYWFIGSDLALKIGMNDMATIIIAKNLGVFIGAISPLLILASLKWPILDSSRLQVDTLK